MPCVKWKSSVSFRLSSCSCSNFHPFTQLSPFLPPFLWTFLLVIRQCDQFIFIILKAGWKISSGHESSWLITYGLNCAIWQAQICTTWVCDCYLYVVLQLQTCSSTVMPLTVRIKDKKHNNSACNLARRDNLTALQASSKRTFISFNFWFVAWMIWTSATPDAGVACRISR